MNKILIFTFMLVFSVFILKGADWYNSAWNFRQEITVSSANTATLTEFPVRIDIDTQALVAAGKMLSSGFDIRVCDSDGTTPLKHAFYRPNRTDTEIWVQVPSIPASGSVKLYLYYGNNAAVDTSDKPGTFSYSSQKLLYAEVSDLNAAGINTDVVSYTAGNQVTVTTATTANYLFSSAEVYTFAGLRKGKIWSQGPISGRERDTANAVTSFTPLCFAGTRFSIPINLNNNKYFCMYNPNSVAANVTFYGYDTVANLNATGNYTVAADNFYTYLFNYANVAIVESDVPILVELRGNTSTGYGHIMMPAAKKLIGLSCGSSYFSVLDDNTDVTMYRSDLTQINYSSLPRGQYIATAGNGNNTTSQAVYLVATKPISAMAYNDGDGTAAFSFWPVEELDSEYITPYNTQYFAVAGLESTTIRLYQPGGVTEVLPAKAMTPSGNYPGRNDFSVGYAAGGYRIKADQPFFAFWEHGTLDECNVTSWKQARQYAYPSPTLATGSEEYLSYFQINGSSTQTAGNAQNITVTARTNLGNIYTAYTGDHSLTFSGASASPSGVQPSCEDKTSAQTSFGSATVITFANGTATTNLRLYKAETAEIEVTDGTVTTAGSQTRDLDVAVSHAASAGLIFSQQPSSIIAGAAVSPAMTVLVRDAYQNLCSSDNATAVTLAIETNPGSGTLSGTVPKTAASGIATFSDISINKVGTNYNLRASSGGLTQNISSNFNVNPAAADHFKITGTAVMTAGTANELTVTAYDIHDNIATGYGGMKSLTFSGLSASPSGTSPAVEGINTGTPGNYFFNFGVTIAGSATLSAYKAETVSLDVTDGSVSSAGNTAWDLDLTVNHGSADSLGFVQQPSSAVAGNVINPSITVSVRDFYQNVCTSDNATSVSMAILNNPGAGTLTGTAAKTAVSGIATFNDLYIDKTGTAYTLRASSGVLTQSTSTGFNISPAAAASLRVTGSASQAAGSANELTVTAYDSYNNIAASYSGHKSLQFSGLSSSPDGTKARIEGIESDNSVVVVFTSGVSGTNTVTLIPAKAEITSVDVTDGTVSSSGNPAWDLDLTVSAGTAENVLFVQQPVTTAAGTSIAPAVTVAVRDMYDNIRTSDNATSVTVALENNPGSSTLGGTLTKTAVSGVSTFGDLNLNKTGSGYTLRCSSGALSQNVSSAFNITPAAAASLRVTGSSAVTAGADSELTVTAYDAFGNIDTAYSGNKSLTFSGPGNSPSGNIPAVEGVNIGVPQNVFFTSGVSTAGQTTLKAYRSESVSVDVTDGTVSSAADVSYDLDTTVSPASPAALLFNQQPSSAVAGVAIAPAVSATVKDAYGNTVTTDNTTQVTVAIDLNPGSGIMSGTLTKQVSAGAVSFNDLSINKAANNYTLKISSSGLTQNSSATFNITPAAASFLTITGTAAVTAGNASELTVSAYDAFDNLATTYSGSKNLTFSGLSASPAGNNPVVEGINFGSAVAVFFNNGVSIAGAATLIPYRAQTGEIDVTDGLITSTGSTARDLDITINPAAASAIVFNQQPSAVTAGNSISPAVSVRFLDQYQNLCTNDNSSTAVISISNNPGTGILSGILTKTAISGIASFSDLSIDRSAAGYTLKAVSGLLPQIISGSFNVNAGAASYLKITGPGVFTAGLPGELNVTAYDNLGNIADSYAGMKSLTFSGLSAAVSGQNPSVEGINLGTAQNIFFNSGVSLAGLVTLIPVRAESASADVTDGTISTNSSAAYDLDVTVNSGTAQSIAFLQNPGNAAAGSTIAPAVTVNVLDQYQNVCTSDNSTAVTLSFQNNPGGSTLSGTVLKTAVNGISSFNDLSIDRTGAGYTLRASSGVLTQNISSGFDISSSPAAYLKVTGNLSMTAGTTNELTVTAYDSLGNIATGYSGFKSLTFSGPQASPDGKIPLIEGIDISNSLTVPFTSGVSAAGALTLRTYAAHTMELEVSDGTVNSMAAADRDLDLSVLPAAVSSISITQQPTDTTAGNAISPAVTVKLLDAYQNTVTTDNSSSVSVSLSANPGGSVLSGTLSRTVSAGQAVFSDLSLNRTGSGYTLSFSKTGISSAVSSSFNISAGSAARLAVTGQSSLTAGQEYELTVTAYDLLGNIAVSYAGLKGLTFSGPAASFSGDLPMVENTALGNPTGVTFTSGISAAGGLTLKAVRAQTAELDVTDGVISSTADAALDLDLTVNHASAFSLSFVQQPQNTSAGASVSPAVTVRTSDMYGNHCTSDSATQITVSIQNNPGNSALGGVLTASCASGTAQFSNLSLNKAASGYTLKAVSGVLNQSVSASFNISPAAAAYLKISGNSQMTAGSGNELTVTAYDQYDNQASGYTGFKSLVFSGANPSSGGNIPTVEGVQIGNPQAVNFSSGISQSNGLTLYAYLAETAEIEVSDGTVSSSGNSDYDLNVAISPALAGNLNFSVQPSAADAGTVISPDISVQIRDQYQNTVTGDNTTTVSLSVWNNPSGGTLLGSLSRQVSSGVAVFSDIALDRSGSGYSMRASTGTLPAVISNSFDISASAVSYLKVTGPSVLSAGSGVELTVTAYDTYGNVATSYTGSKNLVFSGPSAALSGAYPQVENINTGSTVSVSFVSGVSTTGQATFTPYRAGSEQISVTDGSVSSGSEHSHSFLVNPAAANNLAFTGSPSDTAAGLIMTPVSVAVRDQFFNTVTSDNASLITLSLQNNPASAVLSGTLTRSANSGTAVFNDLSLSRAGTGLTFKAVSGSLTQSVSGSFKVASSVAARLKITGNSTLRTGDTTELMVTAFDAFGNTAEAYSGTKTLIFSGISQSPDGTSPTVENIPVGMPVNVNFSNGVSADKSATLRVVKAESSSLDVSDGSIDSNADVSSDLDLSVSHGSPFMAVFGSQPSDTAAGESITSFNVRVTDQFQNICISENSAEIVVSLTGIHSSESVSGLKVRTVHSGEVVFSGLSISKSGNLYQFTAVSPGIISAASSLFSVIPASVSYLAVSGKNQFSAVETVELTVTAKDQFGNTAEAYSGQKTLTFSGLSDSPSGNHSSIEGVYTGTPQTVVFAAGTTAAGALSLRAFRSGTSELDVTDGVYSSFSSPDHDLNLQVSSGASENLLIFRQPSSVAAGESMVPGTGVYLTDAYGNTVTADNSTVLTIAIDQNPGNSVLSGAKSRTSSAGIVEFDGLSLDRAGNRYTFRITGITGKTYTTQAFNVSPLGTSAPLSHIDVSPSPANSGTSVKVTVTAYNSQGYQQLSGGDTVAVKITGNNTMEISATDNGDGTYIAFYTPVLPGTDEIRAEINGFSIGVDSDGRKDGVFHLRVDHSQNYVTADIDNDGYMEKIYNDDNDSQNGFDVFHSDNPALTVIADPDADNDGKRDFLIDVNSDGTPDRFWDPDNKIVSAVKEIQLNGSTRKDWLIDLNGDGKYDRAINPDRVPPPSSPARRAPAPPTFYLDPFGVVFDAFSGTPLAEARVTLFNAATSTVCVPGTDIQAGDQNPVLTGSDGYFGFNTFAGGQYFIVVDTPGYVFPSGQTIFPGAFFPSAGSKGETFTIVSNSPHSLDVPLDPGNGLITLFMTHNRREAACGDIVTVRIRALNNGRSSTGNLKIRNTLPAGFRYLKGKTVIDSVVSADPQGRTTLVFDLGIIASQKEKVLSYQMIAGSSVKKGGYDNSAWAFFTGDSAVSNMVWERIEVIEDPLFSESAIIGTVFHDLNRNGLQEKGEPGVAGAMVATVDGNLISCDENGMYSVRGVKPGSFLLRVLPGKNFDREQCTTPFQQVISVAEGVMYSADFGIAPDLGAIPDPASDDSLVFVAMADLKAGISEIEKAGAGDGFTSGFWHEGRAAYYLKGKIRGKYLIASSYDSSRTLKNTLNEEIDPDRYYPVYGDLSRTSANNASASGKFYLLFQGKTAQALIGDFQTDFYDSELAAVRKGFYGGKVTVSSVAETMTGKPRDLLTVMYSKPRHTTAHDELLSTGGSVYYLSRKNIIPESDIIRIQLRDNVSGEIIREECLVRGADYQIDYARGRIVLWKFLAPWTDSQFGIRMSEKEGNPFYLTADYAFRDNQIFSHSVSGARIRENLRDWFTMGASFYHEDSGNDDYKLAGTDGSIRLGKDSVFRYEYAETKTSDSPGFTSFDGGISFTALPMNNGKKGKALLYSLESSFENLKIRGLYKKIDNDFSLSRLLSERGKEVTDFNATLKGKSGNELSFRHFTSTMLDTNNPGFKDDRAVMSQIAARYWFNNKLSLGAEYAVLSETKNATGAAVDTEKESLLLKAEYPLNENTVVSVEKQVIFTDTDENRTTVAFRRKIGSKLEVEARESFGDLDSTTFRASYSPDSRLRLNASGSLFEGGHSGSESSLGALITDLRYDLGANYNLKDTENDGKNSLVSLDGGVNLTEQTRIYGKTALASDSTTSGTIGARRSFNEQNMSIAAERQLTTVQGNEAETADRLSFSGSVLQDMDLNLDFEKGNVADNAGSLVKRQSFNAGINYRHTSETELRSRFSIRQDRGNSRISSYSFQNELRQRISDSSALSCDLDVSESRNRDTDYQDEYHRRLSLGLAHRPHFFSFLNLLAGYTYLDLNRPDNQSDLTGTESETAHVFSTDLICNLTPRLKLTEKIAWKRNEQKVTDFSPSSSKTMLFVNRLDYAFNDSWLAGLEHRTVRQDESMDQKQAFNIEMQWKVNENIVFRSGFNTEKLLDNLTAGSFREYGPYICLTAAIDERDLLSFLEKKPEISPVREVRKAAENRIVTETVTDRITSEIEIIEIDENQNQGTEEIFSRFESLVTDMENRISEKENIKTAKQDKPESSAAVRIDESAPAAVSPIKPETKAASVKTAKKDSVKTSQQVKPEKPAVSVKTPEKKEKEEQSQSVSVMNTETARAAAVKQPENKTSTPVVKKSEKVLVKTDKKESSKEIKKTDSLEMLTDALLLKDRNSAVRIIEKEKIDFNRSSEYSPLDLAMANGDQEIVELLLKKGFPVNKKDEFGYTPLLKSLIYEKPEIALLLLRYGAEAEVSDNSGNTALMLAVRRNYKVVASFLIFKFADINTKNRKGESALSLARIGENTEMVRLLENYGAK